MARPKSLATLSFDALVKLRDDVADMIGKRATAMQEQLAWLTNVGVGDGRTNRLKPTASSKLKGRKAAVKYRDKEGNKWSGRGAQPRWMTDAIKAGAKRDDFLVGAKKAKPAKKATKKTKRAKRKMKSAKRSKPAKKRVVQRKAAPAPAPSPQA
jgi:DNA-binding protein H-NS